MPTDRRISPRAFVAATALMPVLSSSASLRNKNRQTEPGRQAATPAGFTLFRGWLVLASDKPVLEMRGPAKPTRNE